MSTLSIPRPVYDALRAHGEQTYPGECCGALLGQANPQGWHITAAVPAVNIRAATANTRYEIAPVELVRIQREAHRHGLEIAGFYHSHPDHPAHWSPTDLAEAHWLGCSYVITEVAQGRALQTRSFRLAGTTEEEKRFEQQTILVEDESSNFAR
jgi:proteasome lid subunit RPN8/RPN11